MCIPWGAFFLPVLRDDEALWEVGGKRLARHILVLLKHLCKGTWMKHYLSTPPL